MRVSAIAQAESVRCATKYNVLLLLRCENMPMMRGAHLRSRAFSGFMLCSILSPSFPFYFSRSVFSNVVHFCDGRVVAFYVYATNMLSLSYVFSVACACAAPLSPHNVHIMIIIRYGLRYLIAIICHSQTVLSISLHFILFIRLTYPIKKTVVINSHLIAILNYDEFGANAGGNYRKNEF